MTYKGPRKQICCIIFATTLYLGACGYQYTPAHPDSAPNLPVPAPVQAAPAPNLVHAPVHICSGRDCTLNT